jgi:hypothetical protein
MPHHPTLARYGGGSTLVETVVGMTAAACDIAPPPEGPIILLGLGTRLLLRIIVPPVLSLESLGEDADVGPC